ncbi:phospholipid/cholesterol/gamma-HCH transport system substrate-binding protein [Winogradskyella wandonensis]|uniref:Phospholipid/cholesterol/gamma-HCH transport system substrate-binding protein n=1 Tax=Winogradskyella wandonensis TaxID=1442586 RepID=A0A4R1KVS7_9FLAO|nr:MlaD family protein [Winogradskyella wandonensis]TCK69244.1 phospholipid/cholesterol/gamma-HCH transport system substrate-binding protein [Winogradskyella wandonensis]
MKISREIKTAVLVISGVLLFIYLFNYLKGQDLFSDEVQFYTEFEYNALTMSSPVTIKGNVVGKVEDIKYDFKSGMTRVEFSVDPRLSFSKSSKIRLYETGIMGGNALAVIDSYEGEKAKKGDFIKSEIQPGLISSLKDNFSGLSTNLDKTLRSADTLMVSLNDFVSDETDAGLKATIAELNATLKAFKNLSFSIQNVVKANDEKISETLESFKTASANLSILSEDLKKAELSKTIGDFDKTLLSINGLLDSFEKGEGSLGKLLKDDKLYNNLEAASKEMELLLLDIKLHPARYRRILSKKEIPYEAPTEDQLQKN